MIVPYEVGSNEIKLFPESGAMLGKLQKLKGIVKEKINLKFYLEQSF
jgi:hypothetical protein